MILPQAIVIEYWPQNQCEANTGSNNRLIREVPLEVIPAIQHQDRTIESKLLLKKETKRAYAWNWTLRIHYIHDDGFVAFDATMMWCDLGYFHDE